MKNLLILFTLCFVSLNIIAQPIGINNSPSNIRTLLTPPLNAQELINNNSTGAYCQSTEGTNVFYVSETEKGIELFKYFSAKNYAASLAIIPINRPTTIVDLGTNILLLGIAKGSREDFYRFDLNSSKLIDTTPFISNARYISKQLSTGTCYFVLNIKGQDFIYRIEKDQKNPIYTSNIEGQFVDAFLDNDKRIQGYVSYKDKYTCIYKIEKRTAALKMRREGKCNYSCIHFTPESGELIALTGTANNRSMNSLENINLNTGKTELILDSKSKPYTEITGWKYNTTERKFDFITFIDLNGKPQTSTYTASGKKITDRIAKELNATTNLVEISEINGNSLFLAFNENRPNQFLYVNSTAVTKINSITPSNNYYSSIPIQHRTSTGSPVNSYIYIPKTEKDTKTPIVYLLNSTPQSLHSRQLNAKVQYLVSNGYTVVLWNTNYSVINTFKEEKALSESLSMDLYLLNEELLNQDYTNSISGIVVSENEAAPLVPFAIGNTKNALIHGLVLNGTITTTDPTYVQQFEASFNNTWPEFGNMKYTVDQQLICIGQDDSNETLCKQLKDFNLKAKYLSKKVNNNSSGLNFLLLQLDEIFASKGVYNK